MSDATRCPDCGNWNDAGRETCSQCNHPLGDRRPPVARRPDPAAGGPATAPAPPSAPGDASEAGPAIIRRRRHPRPSPRDSQIVLQLWLVFGTIGVLAVLWVALKSNVDRANQPVEGSSRAQQERADALFRSLAEDSNSVDTHRQLGDLLYDTANWSQAIVHYRAAVRRDSSQLTAIVDLGVCYFNLGRPDEAERHFLIALAKDPGQGVALFNMGIVKETADRPEEALRWYHRALQAGPPEAMKEVLHQRIGALMQKLGRSAPPLPAGP